MVSVTVTVLPALKSPLAGDSTTDDTVGAMVSIRWLPWAMPVGDRSAALPALSSMVSPLRLTPVTMRSGVYDRPARCS